MCFLYNNMGADTSRKNVNIWQHGIPGGFEAPL